MCGTKTLAYNAHFTIAQYRTCNKNDTYPPPDPPVHGATACTRARAHPPNQTWRPRCITLQQFLVLQRLLILGLPTGRSYLKSCVHSAPALAAGSHVGINHGCTPLYIPTMGIVQALRMRGWYPALCLRGGPGRILAQGNFPVPGQKSQGEPERGVDPCVWLLSGGVRIKTRTTMGVLPPVCGTLQPPVVRSTTLARVLTPA